MKWLVMLYVFIVLSIEYFYQLFRCMINRPVVFKDWPQRGKCLACRDWHNRKGEG